MDTKKNPNKDLNKNSGVFFAAGMALVLALTYVALEWKSFYQSEPVCTIGQIDDKDISEQPFVLNIPPPPPKPIVTPPIIKITPDEEETPETFIDAMETDQNTEIADIGDIEVAKVEEEINVDWISIEEVPVFPGCENIQDKRACFQDMMNKHIRKVFRYPEIALETGSEGKVYTQFTIAKDGSIQNILLRGPDKNLEKEAQRIISKLPKMKPGKQRDQNVKVAFSIPINFVLQ